MGKVLYLKIVAEPTFQITTQRLVGNLTSLDY